MMFVRKNDQDGFETDSEYESFEDPEFVIGNEVCDEDDADLYESNVDQVRGIWMK